MSLGGRAGARDRILRRAALVAGALLLLALVLLLSGHWVAAIVFAAAGVAALWLFLQARTVR